MLDKLLLSPKGLIMVSTKALSLARKRARMKMKNVKVSWSG